MFIRKSAHDKMMNSYADEYKDNLQAISQYRQMVRSMQTEMDLLKRLNLSLEKQLSDSKRRNPDGTFKAQNTDFLTRD